MIDADEVDYENILCTQSQLHWLNNIIEMQPTVDAVQVVRCKDCVHHTDDIFNAAVLWCEKSGLAHLRDFYCADGKGEGE